MRKVFMLVQVAYLKQPAFTGGKFGQSPACRITFLTFLLLTFFTPSIFCLMVGPPVGQLRHCVDIGLSPVFDKIVTKATKQMSCCIESVFQPISFPIIFSVWNASVRAWHIIGVLRLNAAWEPGSSMCQQLVWGCSPVTNSSLTRPVPYHRNRNGLVVGIVEPQC